MRNPNISIKIGCIFTGLGLFLLIFQEVTIPHFVVVVFGISCGVFGFSQQKKKSR